jgi:hypothetical protein
MAVDDHYGLLLNLKSNAYRSLISCCSHGAAFDLAELKTLWFDLVHKPPFEKYCDVATDHALVSVDELMLEQFLLFSLFLLGYYLGIDKVKCLD